MLMYCDLWTKWFKIEQQTRLLIGTLRQVENRFKQGLVLGTPQHSQNRRFKPLGHRNQAFDISQTSLLVSLNSQLVRATNQRNNSMFIQRLVDMLVTYSQVPIKRVGPNKRVGWMFIKYFCLSLCLFLSSCFFGANCQINEYTRLFGTQEYHLSQLLYSSETQC